MKIVEKVKSKNRVKFASIYLIKEINLLTKQEYYTPVIEFAKSREPGNRIKFRRYGLRQIGEGK